MLSSNIIKILTLKVAQALKTFHKGIFVASAIASLFMHSVVFFDLNLNFLVYLKRSPTDMFIDPFWQKLKGTVKRYTKWR